MNKMGGQNAQLHRLNLLIFINEISDVEMLFTHNRSPPRTKLINYTLNKYHIFKYIFILSSNWWQYLPVGGHLHSHIPVKIFRSCPIMHCPFHFLDLKIPIIFEEKIKKLLIT